MASKCAVCGAPATKKVIWADGRAFQPSCAKHVRNVQAMLTRKNGKMTELAGVQDLTDDDCEFTVDLVASAAYPGLERKPGGPDNWVERAGGLPSYIERIAKHLHYERGFSISRAIASAVNTVKRWARMGKVAKYGDPNNKHVSPKTVALAAKAVAEWEAKKAKGKINLSDVEEFIIDLTDISDEFAIELAEEIESIDLSIYDSMGTGAERTEYGTLLSMDIKALARRANLITDPEARAAARRKVLDLSLAGSATTIDLASTIAPRNARGRATDGRRSYRGQGKWKHGHIPLNRAAKEAKAKGSPIAIKRLNRLYGGDSKPDDSSTSTSTTTKKAAPPKRVAVKGGRAGQRTAAGKKKSGLKEVRVQEKTNPTAEKANDIAFFRHQSANKNVKPNKNNDLPESQKEASKATRVPKRARQNWDEIPENLKTIRGGKKYVLAEFGGRGYLTEWKGGVQTDTGKNTTVVTSVTEADARKMSASERQRVLNDPRASKAAKRVIRRVAKTGAKP
jgi:hypothetical protein